MQDGDWSKKISSIGFNGSQSLSHVENKEKMEMKEEKESHDRNAPDSCRLRLCMIANAFGFWGVHGPAQPKPDPGLASSTLGLVMFFRPI